jgi:hypothetical protein
MGCGIPVGGISQALRKEKHMGKTLLTLEKTTRGSCSVSEGLPVPGIPRVPAGTAPACSPSAPDCIGSPRRFCCAESAAVKEISNVSPSVFRISLRTWSDNIRSGAEWGKTCTLVKDQLQLIVLNTRYSRLPGFLWMDLVLLVHRRSATAHLQPSVHLFSTECEQDETGVAGICSRKVLTD